MDNKYYYYHGQLNRKARGRAERIPPKRGSIKAQIFASMARSILRALKKIETTLAEMIHYAMADFSFQYLQPWKGDIRRLCDGFIAGTAAMPFSQRRKDFELKGIIGFLSFFRALCSESLSAVERELNWIFTMALPEAYRLVRMVANQYNY